MPKFSQEELDARIEALMERSDELYKKARSYEGVSAFDYEENAAILKETELLIAELRRRQREHAGRNP